MACFHGEKERKTVSRKELTSGSPIPESYPAEIKTSSGSNYSWQKKSTEFIL